MVQIRRHLEQAVAPIFQREEKYTTCNQAATINMSASDRETILPVLQFTTLAASATSKIVNIQMQVEQLGVIRHPIILHHPEMALVKLRK